MPKTTWRSLSSVVLSIFKYIYKGTWSYIISRYIDLTIEVLDDVKTQENTLFYWELVLLRAEPAWDIGPDLAIAPTCYTSGLF
jgi:hypothetical protein